MYPPDQVPLSREVASDYLLKRWGIVQRPATLARKAVTGDGPDYFLAGRFPRYTISELDEWAQTLIRKPRHKSAVASDEAGVAA